MTSSISRRSAAIDDAGGLGIPFATDDAVVVFDPRRPWSALISPWRLDGGVSRNAPPLPYPVFRASGGKWIARRRDVERHRAGGC